MSFWINFWLSIFRFLKLCAIFKDAELGKNNETIDCCFSLSLHCYIRVVENSQFGEIPKLFCAKPILLFAWFWKDLELLLIRHLPTAVTRNCWFSLAWTPFSRINSILAESTHFAGFTTSRVRETLCNMLKKQRQFNNLTQQILTVDLL